MRQLLPARKAFAFRLMGKGARAAANDEPIARIVEEGFSRSNIFWRAVRVHLVGVWTFGFAKLLFDCRHTAFKRLIIFLWSHVLVSILKSSECYAHKNRQADDDQEIQEIVEKHEMDHSCMDPSCNIRPAFRGGAVYRTRRGGVPMSNLRE